MDNPLLLQASPVDVTQEEENNIKAEILEQFDDESMLALQERSIKARGKKIEQETKVKNLDAVEKINDHITDITERLTDPDLINKVMDNVKNGKDFNEAVKGVAGLVELRDKQLDRVVDQYAYSGKKKRIVTQFKSQGVTVTQGVEIDG